MALIRRAALRAVDAETLVVGALEAGVDRLPGDGPVWVCAFGKAAAGMARGAVRALGARCERGVLIVPSGTRSGCPSGFELVEGGHPLPDEGSVAGARAVHELASSAGESERMLILISGGGSALLTLPPDEIPLEEIRGVTDRLIRRGATVDDLNCVRRHLDLLKGGGLARVCHPAPVLGLVVSDVVGDDPEVVASGPLCPDPTGTHEALALLERYGVEPEEAPRSHQWLRRGIRGEDGPGSEAGAPWFERVSVRVVGSGRIAAQAAATEAARLGYRARVVTTGLTGEARTKGGELARLARSPKRQDRTSGPACMIAAGETTVRVTGDGRGGRNQELALAAALVLDGAERTVLMALATDGVDGPTDAAGALATGSTIPRARRAGLDPEGALTRNDAGSFFEALGDRVVTGPTGTNVADLVVTLVGSDSP